MKPVACLGVAALAVSVAALSWAGDWEAAAADKESLGPAKRVMVAAVGKKEAGEPLRGSLVAAHESRLSESGYEGPKVNSSVGYSTVWPEFKTLDDVKDWLKDGHKVRSQSQSAGKVGGIAAIAASASSLIKTECALDAVLAVEARQLGAGAKKRLMAGLTKKLGVPGKSDEAANFETRVTLLSEKGEVVWSVVEAVDKETLEKRAEERQDRQADEMTAKMEGMQKETQARMAGGQATPGDPAMDAEMAKMTPEQRAMAAQAMQNSRGAQMPSQSGMMKSMMKANASLGKRDLGGPENWGPSAADITWDKLAEQFPKRK